jgi:DNA helicase HerA-like ATPase
MSRDDFEYVEKTRQILQKANLRIPERLVDGLLVDLLLEPDPGTRESSRETINDLIAVHANDILFSEKPLFHVPRLPEDGEIRIGKVVQGDGTYSNFFISRDDLQHLGIFAATYSGKTTLIATILTQLMRLSVPIPWMAFDFKRDLRGLSRSHYIRVLRWNWLRINPLQPPPGVELTQWMTFLADIMAHVFGWFHASENYLMQFMQQAYKSKTAGYPTFRELHDRVALNEETGRRFSEYREVVINRLASMLIVLNEVIDAETSFPIERMLQENVVIELDGLRRDEANFLVELMLAYIFSYRLANLQRGKISHLLVFDEASRFFFKGRQFRDTTTELGIPFIDTVPQIIRDYKEGLLCAAQEPSLITHSLMSNLRTKFVGYLSEGEDIEAMCSSLNLDDDEKKELAKIGERGVWLVKKVGIRPFLIKSEDFPIAKDMPDEELQQRMKAFVEELDMLRKQAVPVAEQRTVEQPRVVAPQLSPDAWDLLVNVCGHPFLGIRSRCDKLRVSARRIEAAIQELVDRQLVAPLPIPLGRFRPVKFLVPTSEALNLLGNVGHDTSLWKKIGHVGFEHSLYQVLIAYSLRKKGYEATIEKKLASGRRLDVYCNDGKKKTGIEIEITTANINEKVEGIEELDGLVILVRDEKGLRDGLAFLNGHPAINKVTVQRITEFLRENSTKNSPGTLGTNTFGAEQT